MIRPHPGLVPVLLAACGIVTLASAADREAPSPEQATKGFIQALDVGDRKAYDATVAPSTIASGVFEFAHAGDRFKQKMLKAYGETGWKNFQDPQGARITLAYEDLKSDDLKFEVKDDKATATVRGEGGLLVLQRKDGRWYVDLEATFASQDKMGSMTSESFGKALGTMAKTLREYEEKIGDDIGVDQLDKEIGAAFLAALLNAGAKPQVSVQVK